MSDQTRPTPETDAVRMDGIYWSQGCVMWLGLGDYTKSKDGDVVPAEDMARLERERDEAREALEDLLNDGFDHGMTKIRAARKALASMKGGSDE